MNFVEMFLIITYNLKLSTNVKKQLSDNFVKMQSKYGSIRLLNNPKILSNFVCILSSLIYLCACLSIYNMIHIKRCYTYNAYIIYIFYVYLYTNIYFAIFTPIQNFLEEQTSFKVSTTNIGSSLRLSVGAGWQTKDLRNCVPYCQMRTEEYS